MAALCLAAAASVKSAFYSNFSIVLFLLFDVRDSSFWHTTDCSQLSHRVLVNPGQA